jgi:hypothetical protein
MAEIENSVCFERGGGKKKIKFKSGYQALRDQLSLFFETSRINENRILRIFSFHPLKCCLLLVNLAI